ncbi:MAG: protein tyrosine phosphatase family protein [Woeseia sp.]
MKDPITVNERFVVGRDQPRAEDLSGLARRGFKSLVNLRTPGEEGQTMSPEEEGEQAGKAGLAYTHIPVSGDDMRPEVVDQFRDEVSALPGPVFVHCASGKRSGAFTMMHVGIERGTPGEEVIEKALNMGCDCETPELKDFVRNYVDERRA